MTRRIMHIDLDAFFVPVEQVAKVASEMSKPDGLLEIAEGKERSFPAPPPIARLPGIGQKTERKLKRLGITTIGQNYLLRR